VAYYFDLRRVRVRRASAKLLGLDATKTWHALGIAASQSAGVVENLPTAAKNVGVGNAARNGLFAALLAEQGYTAAPAAIEGDLGWARAMGDDPVASEMTDGLGARWEVSNNTYKPYPCGIVMHAVIDACLALRRDHGLAAAEIEEAIISGDQLLLARGDRIVCNERDARVSIHHCAAVALLYGAAGLEAFSTDMVEAPEVVALRARIRPQLDADSPRGAATATVHTTDGRALTATVLHARGSLEHPLTDPEIEAKVRELARYGAFAGAIDEVIVAVSRLDDMATINPLIAALRLG
jgi:2-methylcitrate dehydratase PrpD